jgi:hypothetical protein
MVRCCGDLSGKLEWDDDRGLTSIAFHDQQVSAIEPLVDFTEPVVAALHLNPAIDAEHRYGHIAPKTTAGSTGK